MMSFTARGSLFRFTVATAGNLLRSLSPILGCAFFASLFFASGCGKTPQADLTATVKDPHGTVQVKLDPASTWIAAQNGIRLNIGGGLKTGDNGQTSLETSEGDLLQFRSDTFFELKADSGFGRQTGGKIQYNITPKGKREVTITTPHAQTTVLGTIFTITVQKDSTEVGLFQGKIKVREVQSSKERILEPGQWAKVSPGSFEMASFTIPQGQPLDFVLPTGALKRSPPQPFQINPGTSTGSGSSSGTLEGSSRIDLNDSSASSSKASSSSSLKEVLKNTP